MTPFPPYASLTRGRQRLQHNLPLSATPIIELPQDVAPEQHNLHNRKARLSNILTLPLKSVVALHRTASVQASFFDTFSQTHRDPNPIEKFLKYLQIRNVP